MRNLFTILALAFNSWIYAQPGAIDLTFNPGTGVTGGIGQAAIQSDGKIIIGGAFTTYNGTVRKNITRLNTDGTLDTAFNTGSGTNSTIRAIAIQSDGKIVIAGSFSTYNDTARNNIARLNTDGTLDTTFSSGKGVDGTIYVAAIQSDGKIIIAGDFSTYNDTARNNIARLNADGSIDATFNLGTGLNGAVITIDIQSDGKIIIGGGFLSYNGTARNNIARLNNDGTLDVAFNPGSGAEQNVMSIAIQSDGKIIIAGDFTVYNGTARNKIARINADGSMDATFNPAGTGANNFVESTALQNDGKIIIAGGFTTYNGTSRDRVTRLNADGTLDTTFNQAGTGANNFVRATALQNDGKIIIAGDFSSYNGTSRNGIARINKDGTTNVNTLSSLENGISIYPNPANNFITMKVNPSTEKTAFTIANQLGQSVLSGILTEVNNTVDITTLTAGMYFIKSGEHTTPAMKFIKE